MKSKADLQILFTPECTTKYWLVPTFMLIQIHSKVTDKMYVSARALGSLTASLFSCLVLYILSTSQEYMITSDGRYLR